MSIEQLLNDLKQINDDIVLRWEKDMPFKSFAQLRKFGSLVKQGKMKESVFREWLSKTDTSSLPERVKKKKK